MWLHVSISIRYKFYKYPKLQGPRTGRKIARKGFFGGWGAGLRNNKKKKKKNPFVNKYRVFYYSTK
jgi:hypothetical protein